MRQYSVEGLIIKRANFGEADKVITLFTKSQGKISFKANSIRKLTSRRAGSLELFNLVKVHVVKGRGSLDVITEVELLETFKSWRSALGRITLAYQLCEVIDKLTPESQPLPDTYNVLLSSFYNLSTLTDDWPVVMKKWLVLILEDLGYWPVGEQFKGDIYEFIEKIIDKPLHSPKILPKLR